jgi:hypothetical protein
VLASGGAFPGIEALMTDPSGGSPDGVLAPAPADTSTKETAAADTAKRSRGGRRRQLFGIAVAGAIVVILVLVFIRPPELVEPPPQVIRIQDYIDRAKIVQQEIFNIERKVWGDNAALTPDELRGIRERRQMLEGARKELEDLRQLIIGCVASGREMPEVKELERALLSTQLRIADADDVLKTPAPPDGPGGFFIPLYATIDASRAAQREVQDLNRDKDGILYRNDAAEKRRARETIDRCLDVLACAARTYSDLDAYVRERLDRSDLPAGDLPELKLLQDEAVLANQALLMARDLKANLLK